MSSTENIDAMKAFFRAFVAARQSFGAVRKNKTNPGVKSQYADLNSVIDAIEEPLLRNGIMVISSPETYPDGVPGVRVTTTLQHVDGGSISASLTMPLPDRPTAHAVGSAITYARRYALKCICNLQDEDDDGNAASQRAVQSARPASAAPVTDQQMAAMKKLRAEMGITDEIPDSARTREGAASYIASLKARSAAEGEAVSEPNISQAAMAIYRRTVDRPVTDEARFLAHVTKMQTDGRITAEEAEWLRGNAKRASAENES